MGHPRAPAPRRRGPDGPLRLGADGDPLAPHRATAAEGRPSRRATSAVNRVRRPPSTGRTRWPGCSCIRTPTRSAFPTRDCRSSTRYSTSAPTPWRSGRTRRGSTWRPRCGRPGCPFSASSSTCRPGLRRAGVQPVGRVGVHERRQPHRSGGIADPRRGPSGGDDPLVVAGGHCAFNPEPLADFVDAFVLGDGEEVVGEMTEVLGAWRKSRPRA